MRVVVVVVVVVYGFLERKKIESKHKFVSPNAWRREATYMRGSWMRLKRTWDTKEHSSLTYRALYLLETPSVDTIPLMRPPLEYLIKRGRRDSEGCAVSTRAASRRHQGIEEVPQYIPPLSLMICTPLKAK
jgi:hypothetical protein